MDTFSSSVSTLKIPSLPSTHRDFCHFKTTPCSSPNLPPQSHAHVSSSSKPNLTSKTKPLSHKGFPSLVFSSSSRTPSSQNPIVYRQPATGYAAAVIDIAQSSNSLHVVQRDVQRLMGFLKDVNFQEPAMVRALVEQGGFHRHLVVLVKMLLKKNKIGIVKQVLEEFERIYDELCGTQVVLVSSATKMEEDQLLGIAENVQKISGALKVKILSSAFLVHTDTRYLNDMDQLK
ncbi:ATP synthase delta chain, chloroplastic isoform X2 [Prosopis cineraria]|uniref:ATP synthase delta chain, chloroplastic isoform X2 n=1 Tax=Prosopis cineraria TaxID=364024 RepID=UPI00240EBC7F|nr:ATP synthase delta chain, chloroplastic isoform X2 [Prosopis cineraria]